MGLKKRQPWAIEMKELEGKGYQFNDNGEVIVDPTKKPDPFKAKKEKPKEEKPKKKTIFGKKKKK